jgi:asparagine synthase (glutamine-hydrolysing)
VSSFFSAYQGVAGIFDPERGFDGEGARAAVGNAFGPEASPDVLWAGSVAAARTPRGSPRAVFGDTICLVTGWLKEPEAIAERLGRPGEGVEAALAAGYAARGPAVLDVLSGSFILLLWDAAERRGLIAQDQLGMRSLYYCEWGTKLLFGSDVFPVLRLLPRRPAPDRVAVAHLLATSAVPHERTPYDGIGRVSAGHLLEFRDRTWKRRRYWAPRYASPARRPRDAIADELWEVVSRAVETRTREADSVGLIMSGGLDSATVASAAAQAADASGSLVRAYSAVFPKLPQTDESQRIELLSTHLDLVGVPLEPRAEGVVAAALEYLAQWELPVSGPGYALEDVLVRRAAQDGVTMLLDGQGGNEILGLSHYLPADRLRRLRLVSSLRLARAFPLGRHPAPWRQTVAVWKTFALKGALPVSVHAAIRRMRGYERYTARFLGADTARLVFETSDPWKWKRAADGPLWWAFKAHLATQVWEEAGLPEYLRHRAAVGGIEARSPLMDLDLVTFCLSIPPEVEFDARHDRMLARRALKGRVPDAVRLWREKSNLAPFYHQCAVGADLHVIRRLLQAPDAEIRAFVKPDAVDNLLRDPPPVGRQGWTRWLPQVWSMLIVESFLRHQGDQAFVSQALASSDVRPPQANLRPSATPGRHALTTGPSGSQKGERRSSS